MKYITSCPQCDTHFLIDDALIEAYGGKVQCGNCEHVFNASDRLTVVSDDVTSAEEYQANLESTAAQQAEPALVTEKNEAPTTTEAELHHDEHDVDYFIPAAETEPDVKPTEAKPESQEPVAEIDQFFNQQNSAEKKSGEQPFIIIFFRWLLILAIILQSVYFLRNEIAKHLPSFKPLLERACVPLNCTIELSQNLDLITIGDSDMQEDDTYQSVINFSSSLQNNASYPQAYPNIQLTLTDEDDNPVIKKLIPPKDYLSAEKKIKSGLAPHEIATVKLALRVDDASVASYRILLLY